MAALWTEICLAMPAIQALGEGYEVYIVTDASGAVSLEAHEMAIQRMIQAGAVPITWMVFGAELQRTGHGRPLRLRRKCSLSMAGSLAQPSSGSNSLLATVTKH